MHDDELRVAQHRALLEEASGPLGLCGPRRALPWVPALSAAASVLLVDGSPEELEALRLFAGEELGVETEALVEPEEEGPDDDMLIATNSAYEWLNRCSLMNEGGESIPPLTVIAKDQRLQERYLAARRDAQGATT